MRDLRDQSFTVM